MASVVESVDVNVPLSTAYNQWTQFEDFPRFMEGVKLVKQLDATHLHWLAEIAGTEEEWDARDLRAASRRTGGMALHLGRQRTPESSRSTASTTARRG